jgi:16S rRNA (cytosine967-C5)-methyltransferase
MTAKQAAILQSAARLLKPGGRSSTPPAACCRRKTRRLPQAFSAAHAGFRPPLPVAEMLEAAEGRTDAASLCSGPVRGNEFLRLWPHRHSTDGFFAAAWEKVQD